jgi:prepilin-type N-terminal cleavage/methylation domain-containing protein/prepilin-type processing-associated H-X9-DG protein
MIYIHRMQNPLSSNLALGALFLLSLAPHAQYDAQLTPISMTKSSPPLVSRAFTLIELLVVIAGIAILLGISVPALSSAYERAKATKDMSNLRQIASAAQMYMNDNNGVLPGSATATWMLQLELNQKYLSTWRVLESPFDKRPTSELGDGTTAASYGINANVYDVNNLPISADKIRKPTAFILFAPAQKSGNTVSFQGAGNSSLPGVKVLAATSTPGGSATGGTHSNRAKINAIYADWHVENMLWSGTGPAFTNTSDPGNDPDAQYRWSP